MKEKLEQISQMWWPQCWKGGDAAWGWAMFSEEFKWGNKESKLKG